MKETDVKISLENLAYLVAQKMNEGEFIHMNEYGNYSVLSDKGREKEEVLQFDGLIDEEEFEVYRFTTESNASLLIKEYGRDKRSKQAEVPDSILQLQRGKSEEMDLEILHQLLRTLQNEVKSDES